jgi:hypothetical protein
LDFRDVRTIGLGISGKLKTKSGIGAGRGKLDIPFGCKGLEGESKGRDRDSFGFSRDWGIMVNALKMANVGREIGCGKVVHAFVEAGMESNLDTLGFDVVPQNVLGGVAKEAKEDAFASVLLKFSRSRAWGLNPKATTKSTHITKVGFVSKAKKAGRAGLIFEGEGVFDAKVAMESIGPESCVKVGTSEHGGAKSIANGLVRTLDRTVLVRTIRACGENVVTVALEESTNFVVVVKFATLVKVDVLAGDLWRVLL